MLRDPKGTPPTYTHSNFHLSISFLRGCRGIKKKTGNPADILTDIYPHFYGSIQDFSSFDPKGDAGNAQL